MPFKVQYELSNFWHALPENILSLGETSVNDSSEDKWITRIDSFSSMYRNTFLFV